LVPGVCGMNRFAGRCARLVGSGGVGVGVGGNRPPETRWVQVSGVLGVVNLRCRQLQEVYNS